MNHAADGQLIGLRIWAIMVGHARADGSSPVKRRTWIWIAAAAGLAAGLPLAAGASIWLVGRATVTMLLLLSAEM